MKKSVFVIDDEKDIQDILRVNLQNEGYDVTAFSSGETALKAMNPRELPDLIVLDIMMEGIDGYEFCRKLRASDEFRSVPILFLSAKTEEFDKVLGLELGADDYMTKPFGIKELKSRVKAILRRCGASAQEAARESVLRYKGIELNYESYGLRVDGSDIRLTKTEFEILALFMRNPGKIFTRDNIIDSIKGHDVYVVDRTIDVHIMNLRKKLGPYKSTISTFSGVGYGFRE